MHKNARHSHQVWRREINGSEYILWTAANAEGGGYFALFNAGEKNGTVKLDLADLEAADKLDCTELRSGEKAVFDGFAEISVPSHGVKAFRFE